MHFSVSLYSAPVGPIKKFCLDEIKTSSSKRIPLPLGEMVGAVALSVVEGRRRPDEGSWRSLWERFPTSIPGFRVLCATCYANLEFRV